MNHFTAFEKLLREAGEKMLAYHDLRVTSKGHHADFVTQADQEVQAFLIDGLHRLYPDALFFAEEKKDNVLTDALTFIIDPIDGTTNFFRGRKSSCISVGAVEGRRAVFGGILQPYTDALYLAERGKGATCNGEPIHVSEVPMERALIDLGTSPYYDDLWKLTGESVGAILPLIADFRRSGSATIDLCDIASGYSEGTFEWLLQPWDYCAASLLIEEAGGRCGNILGGDVTFDGPIPFMAANALCYEPLQQALQKLR